MTRIRPLTQVHRVCPGQLRQADLDAMSILWIKEVVKITDAAAALGILVAPRRTRLTTAMRLCFVRQPKAGQRHSGQADAQFLQRRSARRACSAPGAVRKPRLPPHATANRGWNQDR